MSGFKMDNLEVLRKVYHYLDSIGEELFYSGGWPAVEELNNIMKEVSDAIKSSESAYVYQSGNWNITFRNES